jgi:hypothetical protein
MEASLLNQKQLILERISQLVARERLRVLGFFHDRGRAKEFVSRFAAFIDTYL